MPDAFYVSEEGKKLLSVFTENADSALFRKQNIFIKFQAFLVCF